MKKSVCTIGGGSGMPVINLALVKAGYVGIRSVVTTFDSGGDSGRMRTDERGRIMAYSDYWRSLISLWQDGKQKEKWETMLRFRDGRGRNFGNTFFQFMMEMVGSAGEVDSMFSQLTGAKLSGEVIPVSSQPANIIFKTRSGKTYRGEHYLDDLRMSSDYVTKVWLDPKVEANREATDALRSAEVIIVCPGSMYGSVIANLLPKGMKKAYRESKAIKILMTNLMTVNNENHGYSENDYVEVFRKYVGMERPFDLILMPDYDRLSCKLLAKTLRNYSWEYSEPIRPSKKKGEIRTITVDMVKIEAENLRLRHSSEKLAKFFKSRRWSDLLELKHVAEETKKTKKTGRRKY